MDFLNSWQKNYQRAAYIDTGSRSGSTSEDHARKMADAYGWRYEKITGSLELFEKMLVRHRDHRRDPFCRTPPCDRIRCRDGHPVIPPRVGENRPRRMTPHTIYHDNGSHTEHRHHRIGHRCRRHLHGCRDLRFQNRGDAMQGQGPHHPLGFCHRYRKGPEKLDPSQLKQVEMVALSTTLATNAIVEGDGQKVGLLLMPPYGIYDPADYPMNPKR
jgi:hypothetical protein